MKRRLLIVLKIFPWAALTLTLIYLFCFQGWRDITLGRMHRVANNYFVHFPYMSGDHPVTKVEISLLMGEDSQPLDKTFPVPGGPGHIYGTIDVAAEDISKFLELWTAQKIAYWESGMCHHPAYGVRIYEGDKLTRETSMCWYCSNFSIPLPPVGLATYGFDTKGESGQSLLNFLDERLPYPKLHEEETASDDEAN